MPTPAEQLYSSVFRQLWAGFTELVSFRNAIEHGRGAIAEGIRRDTLRYAAALAHDSEYERFFTDRAAAIEAVGGAQALAERAAEREARAFERIIDSSCLIVAHSVLDVAAFDLLRVTALVAPEAWDTFLAK